MKGFILLFSWLSYHVQLNKKPFSMYIFILAFYRDLILWWNSNHANRVLPIELISPLFLKVSPCYQTCLFGSILNEDETLTKLSSRLASVIPIAYNKILPAIYFIRRNLTCPIRSAPVVKNKSIERVKKTTALWCACGFYHQTHSFVYIYIIISYIICPRIIQPIRRVDGLVYTIH